MPLTDQKSIAVLPFDNLSSDPENEYFSDGMTEEIINALSKISGLKVTARTSSFVFKGLKEDVRIIGNKLGVSTVLEGSIRKSGDRIRIGAQLIRTDNGFHIWSENYDRRLDDIFALQDEISLLIADRIRENFGHIEIEEHLVKVETLDVKAYEDYLRGRFYQLKWNDQGFAQAITYYEKSIAQDSSYPLPYLAASQTTVYRTSWNFISKQGGNAAATAFFNKVGSQHAHLKEYQFSQLTIALWLDWNWSAAYDYGNKLLKEYPSFDEGLEAMAELHYAIGHFSEGFGYIERALALNPLSPNHHFTKGMMHYLSHDLHKAIQSFDRSVELDTHWVLAIQLKACCLILMGNEEELQQLLPKMENTWEAESFQLLFDMIHKGKAVNIKPNPVYDQGYIKWHVYLQSHSGDLEGAYQKLEWGVRNQIGQYVGFAHDPMLSALSKDPKFIALTQEVIGKVDFKKNSSNQSTTNTSKLSQQEVDGYSHTLEKVMVEDKAFLNTSLTLRIIAETIDLHPNKLSWMLNEKVGKNFNDFINGYRLEEFQRKAVNSDYQHLTLLGLAYESGFTSKSVFNDFFKKQTGMTPKAWVLKNRM